MMRRSLRTAFLVLLATLGSAACSRVAPAPGPVPLRDAAHMSGFLAGAAAWELRGVEGVEQYWSFDPDGTFRCWIVSAGATSLAALTGVPGVPPDATMIRGAWSATTTSLSLTSIATEDDAGVADAEVPLRWIDGKLRIGIGGQAYMRRRGPT